MVVALVVAVHLFCRRVLLIVVAEAHSSDRGAAAANEMQQSAMLPSVTDDTPQARSTIVRSNKLNYFKCTTCA